MMPTMKMTLDNRVQAAYSEVWRRLPQPERDVLSPRPVVELSAGEIEGEWSTVARYFPPQAPGGERIVVAEHQVKDLPTHLLIALLAHELAHCFHYHSPTIRACFDDEDAREKLVDTITELWGFNIKGLRRFYGHHD